MRSHLQQDVRGEARAAAVKRELDDLDEDMRQQVWPEDMPSKPPAPVPVASTSQPAAAGLDETRVGAAAAAGQTTKAPSGMNRKERRAMARAGEASLPATLPAPPPDFDAALPAFGLAPAPSSRKPGVSAAELAARKDAEATKAEAAKAEAATGAAVGSFSFGAVGGGGWVTARVLRPGEGEEEEEEEDDALARPTTRVMSGVADAEAERRALDDLSYDLAPKRAAAAPEHAARRQRTGSGWVDVAGTSTAPAAPAPAAAEACEPVTFTRRRMVGGTARNFRRKH
eukprot:TRINITY_DN18177_c0_g1_i2.p1 TRINITY_DN18177_c0_g1~~TRINITY_DN18177_c0_g1_i2.p1  ORF type:complete len:285 (+),score=77.81 TRINITY_DN18177_c0_g1_i2:311-1165(+)